MSATEDALRVKCPDCGASSGAPCTYMAPKNAGQYVYSYAQQAKLARVGTPTVRSHNGRLNRAFELQCEADRRRLRAAWAKQNRDPLVAERRAYQAAFNEEQRQLKEWLRRYGRVLWL